MTVQQALPRPSKLPPAPAATTSRPSRSVLGRVVVFASILALGVLGMVDLSGISIPGSAYLAMTLAVVGAGLLAGAWYGRARWLIAVGAAVIMLLLPAAADRAGPAGSTTWRPTGIQQLGQDYRAGVGNAVLDLSAVDFTGQDRTLQVQVNAGDLQIILPADVNAVVDANVSTGNAHVFATTWGGISQQPRTVIDNGSDGPGGGTVTLQVKVGVGNLEVRR